jgi:prepilin-type N-terminal cleavage/methylation domain-containing protein
MTGGKQKPWAVSTGRGGPEGRAGFTLIELLIVVAIISILASIAVPNYQDALVKSKCAKFMSDCKALETSLEAYSADMGRYPPEDRYPVGSTNDNWYSNPTYPATGFTSRWLTTPIAYLAKLPLDPFPNHNPAYEENQFPVKRPYNYSNDFQNVNLYPGSTNQYYVSWTYQYIVTPVGTVNRNASNRPNAAVWMVNSPGPDGDRDHGWDNQWVNHSDQPTVTSVQSDDPVVYDPSNGTTSSGDLFMFGPSLGFPGK